MPGLRIRRAGEFDRMGFNCRVSIARFQSLLLPPPSLLLLPLSPDDELLQEDEPELLSPEEELLHAEELSLGLLDDPLARA